MATGAGAWATAVSRAGSGVVGSGRLWPDTAMTKATARPRLSPTVAAVAPMSQPRGDAGAAAGAGAGPAAGRRAGFGVGAGGAGAAGGGGSAGAARSSSRADSQNCELGDGAADFAAERRKRA